VTVAGVAGFVWNARPRRIGTAALGT
jgi:hypothetical protein